MEEKPISGTEEAIEWVWRILGSLAGGMEIQGQGEERMSARRNLITKKKVTGDIKEESKNMTWMIRSNALSDFRNLQNEFNRFIDASFPRGEESVMQTSWNPAVDLAENENAVVLEADLPGVKAEDFDLSIENYVLTLRGERKFEKKSEADNYHRVERSYGRFVRTFTLPTTINVDGVKAEFRDGVLRVTLPKREEVRARQIRINVNSETQARTAEAK